MTYDELMKIIRENENVQFRIATPNKNKLQVLDLYSITIDNKQLFFYITRTRDCVVYNIVPNAIQTLTSEEKVGNEEEIISEVLSKPFLKPSVVFHKGYRVNVYRDLEGKFAANII